MYAAANRRTTHRLAALDVAVPYWMRAPGECRGMFGPEVALDGLAEACGLDPVELRIRDDTDVEPDSGSRPPAGASSRACARAHGASAGTGVTGRRAPGARVGTAAALANAVYNATGVRIRDLPLTPDKLVR